ncbi:MAG: restriction endonuclease subunit S [Desulfobacterales bacterium]|nr:restriction endonuclease subunit S [Desulfobacterales bacterium]
MEKNTHNLPECWLETTIGNICIKVQYGYTTKATESGDLKLLRTTDIKSGRISWDNVPYCLKNPEEPEKYLLKDGDVVISRAGSIGFSCLIEKPMKAVFASYLIRFNPLIAPRYFKFFLESPFYWNSISEEKLGIAVQNVNASKLKSIYFPLPSIPEQNEIVSKIEELVSELDSGIESLKKAREQLKTYRQAVLKHAFEGRLTENWRERQQEAGNPPEPAEKLIERIRKEREAHYKKQLEAWEKECEQAKAEGRKKPAKPKKPKDLPPLTEEELAELPELPEGWEWIKIAEISESMKNGIYKPKKFYAETGSPCLRMYNIENGKIVWIDVKRMVLSEDEIKEYELKPGDLLVNRVNSRELVGKTALIKQNLEKSVYESKNIRLRLIRVIESGYVNFWFLIFANKYFNHNAQQTVGMASINQEQIGKMPFPICSTTEQNIVLSEIESRLSVCDQLEQSIEDSLQKAETLRQSILKKAFSGELTRQWRKENPELVSGENSAERLLERIREEKKKVQGAGGIRRGKKKSA